MMRRGAFAIAAGLAGFVVACAPRLEAPRESIRIQGVVEDVDPKAATSDSSSSVSTSAAPSPTATPAGVAKPPPIAKYPTLHQMPLGVAVYESCSPQLFFFKKCPGKFLGEAKLVKPGPFIVEVDTQAPEIVVFGFRGFLGPEQDQEACAEAHIPRADATKPIALKLQTGTCSIKLEKRYG